MVNRLRPCALAFAAALSAVGCGSQTLEEAVEAAKKTVAETTQQTVESAQQAANTAQQAATSAKQAATAAQKAVEQAAAVGGELRVDPPLKFAALAARIVPAGGGRPALLQLATAFDDQAETFPALHIQAELDAAAGPPATWAGKTFPAELFAAASDAEGVWRSPPGQPVQLRIVSVQGAALTCELAAAALARVDQPQTATAAANLSAALVQEAAR